MKFYAVAFPALLHFGCNNSYLAKLHCPASKRYHTLGVYSVIVGN
ncbi:hypothetical protein EVA_11584 [gut metagenome]|uniref:Uncharacterized protein n=1 Tax=gut metagenome TaxID=749906 RepID=J9GKT7_9ZZZZ